MKFPLMSWSRASNILVVLPFWITSSFVVAATDPMAEYKEQQALAHQNLFMTIGKIFVLTPLFFPLVLSLISLLVCVFFTTSYHKIPVAQRSMGPGLSWLLLIPFFNLIWNFFIFSGLPKSIKNCQEAVGEKPKGDNGAGLGLAYSIVCLFCLVPFLNLLMMPIALVLLVVYVWKVSALVEVTHQKKTTIA